jgi:hypothetical protein
MKYIKIFEAFESDKLNKTLNFLDKNSKITFIKDLKEVCLKLDIPYSKINDSYIEYLPYKTAINKFISMEDQPCDATSRSQFGANAIEGETCQNGKLKRTWGKGVRIMDCPRCKGTGAKPRENTLKLIKYWFDSEGKYITKTGVSGVIKENNMNEIVTDSNWSPNRDDYELVRSVPTTGEGIGTLQEGNILSASRHGTTAIGIYNRANMLFVTNNPNFNGSRTLAQVRRKYGITYGQYIGYCSNIEVLRPVVTSGDSPFRYNFQMSSGVNLSPMNTTKNSLANAHFALILDVDKLKDLEHSSLKKLLSDRQASKKGAFLKDDEFKKMNIDRYLSKLSDMPVDIKNCKNTLLRTLGGNMIFFFIRKNLTNNINSISGLYYNILKTLGKDGEITNQANYDRYKNDLKAISKNYIENRRDAKEVIKSNLDRYRRENVGEVKKIKILEEVESISKIMFDCIKDMEVKTIEDLDILLAKILTLINYIGNGRYPIYYIYSYMLNYVTDTNYRRFYDYMSTGYLNANSDLDETLEYLGEFKNVITRFFK